MSLIPPHNIRLDSPTQPDWSPPSPPDVPPEQDGGDLPILDDSGAVIRIEHGDGSLTISLDGRPINEQPERPTGWFENLAEKIDDQERARIVDDLLRSINEDIQSRQEWIEDKATGIKLLGLKLDIPGLGGSAEGAPVEGMSRVRHPLLLEAVLRFQANARGELLPTDGPVKIRNDANEANTDNDRLADILENDLNHYLTAVATEYYPDTDKMLLQLGFGGTAFKKVYFCPLRNRPVSETVDADDLIVNNAATDLNNARRITHRVYMRPSTVRRMQIIGAYRDIDLGTPNERANDSLRNAKKEQEGIQPDASRPEDRDREIFECYCELDLKGFEHKLKGQKTGLEIPYVATIDVSSKELLSLVRNYEKPSKDDVSPLPEAEQVFVKYTFVPGFGFYDIGLLQILGNATNAVTAAWREMLDNGMYANFPGFLLSNTGARQNTNIFRVPPGGGALVNTGGQKISEAVMPLPYNSQGMPALMSLTENIVETGQRLGGTAELPVSEGRADAPVGTTLALIEQSQKVIDAVHKRMHSAQAREFQLLAKCFKAHPESFIRSQRKGVAYEWDEKTFIAALDDLDLVPQADPNTASHIQRIMKVAALKQLQQAQPALYDPLAIDTVALRALGWSNPQQFFAPPAAQAAPPPQLLQAQAEMQAKTTTANARMLDAQTKARQAGLAGNEPQGPSQQELAIKALEAKTKARQVDMQAANNLMDARNDAADRQERLTIEAARLKMAQLRAQEDMAHDHKIQDKEHIMRALEAARALGVSGAKNGHV
jgi:hypothetical protein